MAIAGPLNGTAVDPIWINIKHIIAVTADRERIRSSGKVEDFEGAKHQRVDTTSGQVDRLDSTDLVVGDRGQVERDPAAIQCQRVIAGTAVDTGKRRAADLQDVITFGSSNQYTLVQDPNLGITRQDAHPEEVRTYFFIVYDEPSSAVG